MLVGIQNAAASSKKQTKDLGLHKGNTGSQTKVYSQKGLTAMTACVSVIDKNKPCFEKFKTLPDLPD